MNKIILTLIISLVGIGCTFEFKLPPCVEKIEALTSAGGRTNHVLLWDKCDFIEDVPYEQ